MSQSDSFFNEVSEEVRRESLRQGLNRYGWIILLLVIVAIGSAIVIEWRKHSETQAAQAAGDALRAAYLESDPAKRAEALGTVATAEPEAAAVARLAEAGSQIEAGDTAAAAATLATLADAPDTPELYRGLASLLRVMALGDAMDPAEREATLETLANGDSPFQPLALEQRAVARLAKGDKPGALADLDAILASPVAPEQLSNRARQLILAAGGELPVTPLAPAAASDG